MSDLRQRLEDFRNDANAHPRVRQLINNWSRTAGISATDTGESFLFMFESGRISEVVPGTPTNEQIVIRGEQHILERVFTGALNPASAHLAGDLQVLASEVDQVKLDAITMVLWGD